MSVAPDSNPRFERRLRLGFVPLSDCAPIAVAKETGIFERYGLDVCLSREPGWNSVRDKIYHGELDAAQSIAGMALSLGMGFSDLRCDVVVPLILNLQGNAITLSSELPSEMIGRGDGLVNFLSKHWKKSRPFTLAATHRFSSHHILLHTWLRQHGLSCPQDAQIVFLSPRLMTLHLKAGNIDGYCVGEPWNSEAVLSGIGWCPVSSLELSQGHPEKVLLLSGRFLRKRREESVALVAALLDACKLCQEASFQEDLIRILSLDAYTGSSPEVLRHSMAPANDRSPLPSPSSYHVYHGETVNRPTVEKASWVLAGLKSINALPEMTAGSVSRIYREDLFHEAQQYQLPSAAIGRH